MELIMKIVNLRNTKECFKVDRSTPFGNPFRLYKESDRGLVLDQYCNWIYAPEQKWLRDKMRTEIPKDATLGCWCYPKLCHAMVIACIVSE
jgi:hypothetical protein